MSDQGGNDGPERQADAVLQREEPLGKVSRGTVIGLAIGITLVALTAFAVVFMALSSGFDSLAKKAAKSLSPAEGSVSTASTGSGSGSAPPSGPSAPGL